jgi:hypothetical protein
VRPIRSTAMPRHGISMMALVPRPPRHRSSLRRPPFPRRTQERACSSAPAPGSDQWTDHSFHAWRICVALPHAPPSCSRADYEASRIALHCMSCGDNRARVPPPWPMLPRRLVSSRLVTDSHGPTRKWRKVADLFRPPSLPLLPSLAPNRRRMVWWTTAAVKSEPRASQRKRQRTGSSVRTVLIINHV